MHWKHSRSEESVQRRRCHLIWQLFACSHLEYCNKCVVLSECRLPPRIGSTLPQFLLFRLLYIQNMRLCCHHNSVCHLKLFKCFDFARSFKNVQQSFWRTILLAGLARNRSIWTGTHDSSDMFITSRGSQLTLLLPSPSLSESSGLCRNQGWDSTNKTHEYKKQGLMHLLSSKVFTLNDK